MNHRNLLDESYPLSQHHIDFYRTNGFIKLKNVLESDTLKHYGQLISQKVVENTQNIIALSDRDTYGKAFLQIFNLWREDKDIKKFIFSKRLAKIATQLMEVKGVRMYHDQALFKESNGGYTPWHADQYYWPLSSDKTITAWIPLQKIEPKMGPLEFSAGSQVISDGRALAISDESEKRIEKRLRVSDFKKISEPFDWGEVSFHSGWVFHRAGPNTTNQTRKVMTIIYMDKEMQLKTPTNDGQRNDWDTWCPGAKVGEIIDSPLNPILY